MKSNPAKKKSVKRKSVRKVGNEDGGSVEAKPRLLQKQTKQLRFLSKLEDVQRTLSASKTLVKKKRKRTREKAAKVLSLSSLADSLPSTEDIMAAARTFHKKVPPRMSRQQIVVKETKQLAAVLAQPEFQNNPFLAIQQHLTNTIPVEELPTQKQEQGKKKKTTKLPKKRSSVQDMDE